MGGGGATGVGFGISHFHVVGGGIPGTFGQVVILVICLNNALV